MIFSKKIKPLCIYCEHGMKIIATDDVICPKKGIVSPYFHCKHFLYTPLKRVPPKRNVNATSYEKKDFEF